MSLKKPFVPVVAVLNMKGGVGKTTISAHLLRVLFERKKAKTLLIDLDPQFNLTQALFTKAKYDSLRKKNQTIQSVMEPLGNVSLFQINTSSAPIPAVSELAFTFFHFKNTSPLITLDIVPGDFRLVKYSLMADQSKLDFVKKRYISFIDSCKQDYRVICIDCNPSSSFLTLCALQVCTHILVPVRPDRYSILGLEMLSEFVDSMPVISPKPQFIVVLNGTPRKRIAAVGRVESELRSHSEFGARTLAREIHETGLLRAKIDYTGFATDRRVAYSKLLKQELTLIADELATKIGL